MPPSKSESRSPKSAAICIPAQPYEPGEEAWYAHAETLAFAFLAEDTKQQGPELVMYGLLCINVCADLVWEMRRGAPSWDALGMRELWQRLELQEQAFPQPPLVLAFHDTLRAFLPWLVEVGGLSEERRDAMLAELDAVKDPLYEQALARVTLRNIGVDDAPRTSPDVARSWH